MKSFSVTAGGTVNTLKPGQVVTCSTALGLLMQPAVMIIGLLFAWPLGSARAIPGRLIAGSLMLALWVGIGIPLSLWLYFQDIPILAFAPNVIVVETIINRFMLNGGSLVLGALLAAMALAVAAFCNNDVQQLD
jgi:hypothetical protein